LQYMSCLLPIACCQLLPVVASCCILKHPDFHVLLPACPPACPPARLPAERGELPQGSSGQAQAAASTAGGRQVVAEPCNSPVPAS
jgi:hypothetical protein